MNLQNREWCRECKEQREDWMAKIKGVCMCGLLMGQESPSTIMQLSSSLAPYSVKVESIFQALSGIWFETLHSIRVVYIETLNNKPKILPQELHVISDQCRKCIKCLSQKKDLGLLSGTWDLNASQKNRIHLSIWKQSSLQSIHGINLQGKNFFLSFFVDYFCSKGIGYLWNK